jgi:ABC-type glycerol-3-phosphate transport system permease component
VTARATTDAQSVGWRDWFQGPVVAMVFLGFACGLPLLLVFSLLGKQIIGGIMAGAVKG